MPLTNPTPLPPWDAAESHIMHAFAPPELRPVQFTRTHEALGAPSTELVHGKFHMWGSEACEWGPETYGLVELKGGGMVRVPIDVLKFTDKHPLDRLIAEHEVLANDAAEKLTAAGKAMKNE